MPFQTCAAFCGTSEATAVHGKACCVPQISTDSWRAHTIHSLHAIRSADRFMYNNNQLMLMLAQRLNTYSTSEPTSCIHVKWCMK